MTQNENPILSFWLQRGFEHIHRADATQAEIAYRTHVLCSALYDACAAFDDDIRGYYANITTDLVESVENKTEAVSFAAFAALIHLFPGRAVEIRTHLGVMGYCAKDQHADRHAAAGLGILAAQTVIKNCPRPGVPSRFSRQTSRCRLADNARLQRYLSRNTHLGEDGLLEQALASPQPIIPIL